MYTKFASIFISANYKKRIQVQCLVTGKTSEAYTIPKRIGINCNQTESCGNCAVNGMSLEINADNDNVIHFIDVKQNQINGIIKGLIKRNCKSLEFDIIDVQNVERIFISQPTGRYRDKFVTTQVAYYVGYGIDSNYNYDFTGVATIDPASQVSTVVFDKAKKLKTDIESFKLSPAIHESLKQFQIANATPEKIFEKLNELYDSYAHNVTKIYERFDLHLALDLAFRTVISFRFDNDYVKKGWADILIIGDSRTGKGFVADGLSNYFNVGEVASAENCTIAGLVAGAEQYRGHWAVAWGRIPLNDLGLLILDEAANLGEDWGKLDRIRSEGVAEIDKIIKQVTNARTRLLALCNPIKRKIGQYSYGVQAILEVMEAPENIARLDYALVLSDTEVDSAQVNKRRGKDDVKQIYSQEAEQNLIMWTWSRQTDDIVFTDKAIDTVYALANKLGTIYTSEIPLIQGTSVRIKLAKIAIAFAARFYSCDETGKKLIVDDVHVNCAHIFLNTIYKKASCGYFTMSQLNRSLQASYTEEDMASINKYLSSFTNNKAELCKCLLNNNVLTTRDIAEHLNFSNEIATEIISKLLKYNMIIKKFQNCYVKNKQFTDWLKNQVLTDNKMEVN